MLTVCFSYTLDRKPHSNVRESHLVLFILVPFVCWEKKHPPHRQLINPDFQGFWPLSNRFSTICQNIDGHIQAFSACRINFFTIFFFFFSNSTTAWLPVVTFLIGRLSDPREANKVTCTSSSSSVMVPYVCQNVYVVCFFQPDLCPSHSSEPHSPRRRSELHAIYKELAAGALPAKLWQLGGEWWDNHRSFRLIQALEIALQCPESRLDQVDVTNSLFALYAHKHTHTHTKGMGQEVVFRRRSINMSLNTPYSGRARLFTDFPIECLVQHRLRLRFTALLPSWYSF